MAIALTPFKAMCGFRPIQEVADFLTSEHQLKILGSCASEEIFLCFQLDIFDK